MLSVAAVGCCTDYIPPVAAVVHRRGDCSRFGFAAEKGKGRERRDKTRFQSLVGGRGVNAVHGKHRKPALDPSSSFRSEVSILDTGIFINID